MAVYQQNELNSANKTTCNDKTETHKLDVKGIILRWQDLTIKCSKSAAYIDSIRWKYVQYIFISGGAAFSYASAMFEKGLTKPSLK